MIPEVGGPRLWGPSKKRAQSVSRGPILLKKVNSKGELLLKKFKISKKGPFSLYIGSPSGPPQNMKLMGPEGDGPPGPPPFLRPWPLSTCTWRCFGAIDSGHWIQNPLVSKNIASAFATTARALRSENSYVTISDEITVFVDTMLPAAGTLPWSQKPL